MAAMKELLPTVPPGPGMGPYTLETASSAPRSAAGTPSGVPLPPDRGQVTVGFHWPGRPPRGSKPVPPLPIIQPVVLVTPNPEAPGATDGESLLKPDSLTATAVRKAKDATPWTCPDCQHENDADATACSFCHYIGTGNSIPPWNCPTCQETNTHPNTCEKCGLFLSMLELWSVQAANQRKCPNCTMMNDNSLSVCKACEAPMSDSNETASAVATATSAPAAAATTPTLAAPSSSSSSSSSPSSKPSTPFVFSAAPSTSAVLDSSMATSAESKPLFSFGVAPSSQPSAGTGFTFGATAAPAPSGEGGAFGSSSTVQSTAPS